MMKKYYIYCITNILNNKKYIGKTVDPKRRWRMHKNMQGGCTALHNAIKKYGSDFFKFEIINFFYDEKKSYECEYELVKKFNTKQPYGYNITDGGIGFVGNTKTKEHIEKVANAHRGLKRSELTKKRISESKIGIKKLNIKKVNCYQLNEIGITAIEASNKYKISYSAILKCTKKQIISAGKHPVTNEKLIWTLYE